MIEEPERTSRGSDPWVSNLINEARHTNPLVVDSVLDHMEQLLGGVASDRGMTATALKKIATELLDEMGSASSESETAQ